MRTELPITPPSETGNRLASRTLSPMRRWFVLGIWMGLMLFGAVALWPERILYRDTLIRAGIWIAQACLLAAWAMLAGQPLSVRLPWTLGLVTCLTLVNLGIVNQRPYRLLPLILLIPLIFLVLLPPLSLVRRRFGWQIAVPEEHPAVAQRSTQFSLRQLLSWIVGTAVLLALAKCLLPAGSRFHEDWRGVKPVPTAVVGTVTAAVFLPVVLPLLGLVLARANRLGFARWTLVTVSVLAAMVFGSMIVPRGTPWHDAAVHTICLMSGFLGVFVGTLLVLRFCGYRLLRRKDDRI